MTLTQSGSPSVDADIGQITPKLFNAALVKDVLAVIKPIADRVLPSKRSGYSYAVFALYQTLIQISELSPDNVGEIMNNECKDVQISFQEFHKTNFQNQKHRRYFPDQPSLSRCLKHLAVTNHTEAFWNTVLFSNLIMLQKLNIIRSDITLIADYTTEPCRKDSEDPYCFGTKKGKTVHKTLTFSIISRNLHQIIANYKIYKYQNKLPLFEEIMEKLQSHGFFVKYALLDRGFYRKRLLSAFKQWHVTVIMPGRKCNQTQTKIQRYLTGKGTRYCKGFTKLKYVKGVGYPLLRFDLLLCAKRKYHLNQIKLKFRRGTISRDEATRHIFPLIVMFGNRQGISTLHGNESYIRFLYRCRWFIEIAFREMNRLGITQRVQCRDTRLGIMGAKSLVYNFWQLQRHRIEIADPSAMKLELDEFLGKTQKTRYAPISSL